MADNETTLHFVGWHRPALPSGDYTIALEQKLSARGIAPDEATYRTPTKTFSVQGPRFTLAAGEVHAVFPADGSLGDHQAVLPHVALKRSTLPWERRSDEQDEATPWLALLVFHEGEACEATTMTLKDAFPDLKLETGQRETDPVRVIDVEPALLVSLLPTSQELALLTHVRQRGEVELAVVIAGRLPKPGGFSTAHLVSLEGRYAAGHFDTSQVPRGAKARLTSLLSFRFACLDERQSFTGLLRALDGARSDDAPATGTTSTLRLPARDFPNASAHAQAQLARGAVPLPHTTRQGQRTMSWFHGPLAPAHLAADPGLAALPVHSSDALLRYSATTGMLDASYAAAWELGRLLALQDKRFSVELAQWKQEQAGKRTPGALAHPLAIPSRRLAAIAAAPPQRLRAWLDQLACLSGVPFAYLVPDERMLPLESLRFFRLDDYWIDCLLDGAFSLGRAMASDLERDRAWWIELARSPRDVTGVLLRSAVVSDWPGLQIDGYGSAKDAPPLQVLRAERLGPSLLLCLFAGDISRVVIHQKVETLHFGFDVAAPLPPAKPNPESLSKRLRDSSGALDSSKTVGSIPRKAPAQQRVIDVARLATLIKDAAYPAASLTSSEMALQMIEGVQEVTFTVSAPP